MDAKFRILGSSSAGNSSLLVVEGAKILIDAGLSARKLQTLLAEEKICPEELDAVFLTHEHHDHSAGIRGLSKFQKLPVFANRDTVHAVQSKLPRKPNWKIFETGKTFEFKVFKIHPFSVPHDAYDPVGFFFQWGEDDLFNPPGSLAWVTDLGFVPNLVRERIRKAQILVLESNYCPHMLEADNKRPWSLKQRIRSRHGHLSNHSTFELLNSYNSSCWQKIFIMHLSKDCNDVNLVCQQFKELNGQGNRFKTFVIDPLTAEPHLV
ncbi:MAG: MBL fold metallo-hydrolase [Verrucomicrobia bacterium TMED56]|nr:MAG: MBL fold metallo-hydrolase [Verrucomicrobia bacterium TMED56]